MSPTSPVKCPPTILNRIQRSPISSNLKTEVSLNFQIPPPEIQAMRFRIILGLVDVRDQLGVKLIIRENFACARQSGAGQHRRIK